jgi:hypothetical protein
LDVESLFTNVPVEETIQIICDNVYSNPTIPPPPFDRKLLEKLLTACTMKAPFRHVDGSLYQQIDGVAMGSPLGVCFANFYMCHIENQVLAEMNTRPTTYCRYIDDCYIVTENEEQLDELKQKLEERSVLRFTIENSVNNNLNFLDVAIDGSTGRYVTSLHRKTTNPGFYLNARSECPDRYKTGTVHALIHRTYKICSDWTMFTNSIQKIKQSLINNGYSNTMFDDALRRYLDRVTTGQTPGSTIGRTHTVYYRNQFSSSYKADENILRKIIMTNVTCTNPDDNLKLQIYYKNAKTSQFIMKNNVNATTEPLKTTNVVYEFKCNTGECELQPSSYIGMTTTSLSRRLTMHLASGGPKTHMEQHHRQQLTREHLVNNTIIRHRINDFTRLQTVEAILILNEKPIINRQATGIGRTLRLLGDIHAPGNNV